MARFFLLLLCGCGGLPAAGTPDLMPPGQVTLTMTSFTVAPSEERYRCQDFANPFGSADASVTQFDSHLSSGAHHLLVFYKIGAQNAAAEDCSGTEFAPGPYGSQRLDDTLVYPAGVAARIPSGEGFRIQAHFLNATQAPLTATVQLTMTRAPDGSLLTPAAVLFMDNTNINIPASATGVVAQKTCTLPFDVNLIQATGHMHRHGISFVASAPSGTLFSSTAWSDVTPALFDPPLPLAAGTAVTFACTYDNDGATPIGYGESALTDEMCIFSAQFFPAPFGGWTCP